MAVLKWDEVGSRFYETGVSNGVLYLRDEDGAYPAGVVWNGLTSVTENPSGGEANPQYADNMKYLVLYSAEDFGASVEAFTYPDEFAECDGSASILSGVPNGIIVGGQKRRQFGLVYKTKVGNDVSAEKFGYKIHCIYGATAAASERPYTTINDSPEAITFSWELSTTPVEVPGFEPTAVLTIDSTKFTTTEQKAKLKLVEDALFGTSSTAAYLPLPEDILDMLK